MMVAHAQGRDVPTARSGRAAKILLLSICSLAFSLSPSAHDGHKHHQGPAMDEPVSQSVAEDLSVPRDIALRNQDGERVNFYRDLVADKVVAINTIYTSCVTLCPTMGIYFAELQRHELVGGRIGRDINLISISIDPGIDTPDRLKAWSGQLGALPGWTLLTGSTAHVRSLLEGLGIQFPGDDKSTHSQLVLIGNDSTDKWTYVRGDASPDVLAEAIDAALGPH